MTYSNKLSEREKEILSLVATGASNKQIAQQLFISANTVKVHVRNIFTKLGVSSRTEASLYAYKTGLYPLESEDESVLNETQREPIAKESIQQEYIEPSARVKRYLPFLLFGVIILVIGSYVGSRVINNGTKEPEIIQQPEITTDVTPWKERASMLKPRTKFAVETFENQIYIIAGETDDGINNDMQRYDPKSDSWEILSSKPLPVSEVSAVLLGGKIFVPGGLLPDGKFSNKLDVYNPRKDVWQELSDLPIPLSAYALVSFEGKLFLFGGRNTNGYLDTVYSYNPSEDKWDEHSSMPTPRGFAGAAVSRGKIFILGGYDGKNALTINEVYHPELDNGVDIPWVQKTSLPSGRYGMGVASIADFVYVVGGVEEGGSELMSLEYLPNSEEWQSFGILSNENLAYLGLVSLSPYLYRLGGEMEDSLIDDNMSYQAKFIISIPVLP